MIELALHDLKNASDATKAGGVQRLSSNIHDIALARLVIVGFHTLVEHGKLFIVSLGNGFTHCDEGNIGFLEMLGFDEPGLIGDEFLDNLEAHDVFLLDWDFLI